MLAFQVLILLLSSVSILALPFNHDLRSNNAIVARAPLRRRSSSGRCAPNSPSSSSTPSSLFTSSSSSTSISSSVPTVPPVGVEAPPTQSSSSPPPPPPAPTTTVATSVAAPPPPAPTPTPTPTPPAPAPAPAPAPSSSSPAAAPAPAPSQSQTASTSGTFSGQGTFYEVGLGACGVTNVDTDMIVAVSESLFDSYPGAGANPNLNPVCGRQITANYQGKSVTVTVEDRCTGCGENDLDFSPSAFDVLADPSLGRIDITWSWD